MLTSLLNIHQMGQSFSLSDKMAGHGTVSTEQKYQFTDNNPVKGVNYYRLKQVDYDGNFTYSKTATVTFENLVSAFKIFPNPAVNNIQLTLPQSTQTSVINLFDINGKKLMEKQLDGNIVSQTLDVSTLAAGVYQLTLIQGTQQQTLKLIKE
jgi:hypothetical protein